MSKQSSEVFNSTPRNKKEWSAPKLGYLGSLAEITQKHSNDGEGGGKNNNSV